MCGNIANVPVLEHLKPGPQTDDDAAAHIFRRLLENGVRRFGGMGHRKYVEERVQLFFRTHSQQLVHLSDIFDFRRENQGFEQVELRVVPEVVAPLAACIFDDDITEQLCHQFLPLNLR